MAHRDYIIYTINFGIPYSKAYTNFKDIVANRAFVVPKSPKLRMALPGPLHRVGLTLRHVSVRLSFLDKNGRLSYTTNSVYRPFPLAHRTFPMLDVLSTALILQCPSLSTHRTYPIALRTAPCSQCTAPLAPHLWRFYCQGAPLPKGALFLRCLPISGCSSLMDSY